MATIDQQFVEYIVKTLVNNPDGVEVDRKIDEKGVLLSLTVDPSDVGRVIGKRGVTAQAIRVLLRALGTKQDARYNLKIVNTDEDGAPSREGKAEEKPAEKKTEVEKPEEVAADDEEVEKEDEKSEGDSSELAEKTRAEMADLDDLDI
ncbi:KH domain-containing protein [Candidatus Saccharibacteria bacterium]|nr:KH domain-containing protein [Candidatus Saccharibacteria bacterium]MBR3121952.1 KH domain-containing protein [Candidatus Saccharibacteria bacterium]